jgi:hypothetical protein
MAGWRLAMSAFWAVSAVLVFALYAELFGLHGWDWGRAGVTAGTAAITYAAIRAAWDLRAWIRPFRTNRLEIDDSGMQLRIADRGEVRLAWPDVAGLRHEQRTETTGGFWPMPYRVDCYILTTSQGPVSFTSMDIPGAKRAAQEITKRLATAAPFPASSSSPAEKNSD